MISQGIAAGVLGLNRNGWRVEAALVLAAAAHAGQPDKQGQPYILHPVRAMVRLGLTESAYVRAAAILHDVVEDTEVTLADLAAYGFPEDVVAMVDDLTRRKKHEPKETHREYMERICASPRAGSRRVKLADMADNQMPGRRFKGDEGLKTKYDKGTLAVLNSMSQHGEEILSPTHGGLGDTC